MIEMVLRDLLVIARPVDEKHISPDRIDVWLERLHGLTDDELEDLSPLVLANGAADCMRRLIRMCTILAHPERALDNWLGTPCDELLTQMFQLHSVATYLMEHERGQRPHVVTLEQWCAHVLAMAMQADEDSAQRIARWFAAAQQDKAAAAWPPSAPPTERSESSGSDEAAPEEITDEDTSRIDRERQAGGGCSFEERIGQWHQ